MDPVPQACPFLAKTVKAKVVKILKSVTTDWGNFEVLWGTGAI